MEQDKVDHGRLNIGSNLCSMC